MAKPCIIAGLDIGTSFIKTLIAAKIPGESDLEILGIDKTASLGVRKGTVINIEEVSKIIQLSFEKAQKESKQKISSLYINIGGSHVSAVLSRGTVIVSRADQKISQEDVNRVLQASQAFPLHSNREILDVVPKEFIVDGQGGIKDILGMEGVKIEAEVLAITVFSPYLKNLTQAVLNSNFQIDDIIASPLDSSRAILTSRQKELGVVLLDIGAGTTGMAVFEEGDLIHLAVFPIGSNHISKDIAIGLKCDIEVAERIKLEFGSCFFSKGDKKIKIEEDFLSQPLIFSQKMLRQVIDARISEIFEQVNKELKKISRQSLLPGGVVLTGGGANLPGITELAKKELKLPSQIGKTTRDFLFPQEDPSLSAVYGLVLIGADSETEKEKSGGFLKNKISSKIKRIFKIFIP